MSAAEDVNVAIARLEATITAALRSQSEETHRALESMRREMRDETEKSRIDTANKLLEFVQRIEKIERTAGEAKRAASDATHTLDTTGKAMIAHVDRVVEATNRRSEEEHAAITVMQRQLDELLRAERMRIEYARQKSIIAKEKEDRARELEERQKAEHEQNMREEALAARRSQRRRAVATTILAALIAVAQAWTMVNNAEQTKRLADPPPAPSSR